MRYLPIILLFIACTSYTGQPCENDTIYVKDAAYIDSIYSVRTKQILEYADSVFLVRRFEIAKLRHDALMDVQYARYQFDTMQENFMRIKNARIYNNIINRNPNTELTFDSAGVPIIINK